MRCEKIYEKHTSSKTECLLDEEYFAIFEFWLGGISYVLLHV